MKKLYKSHIMHYTLCIIHYILAVTLLSGCGSQNSHVQKSKDSTQSKTTENERVVVDLFMIDQCVAEVSLPTDWTKEFNLNHYQNAQKTIDLWITIKEVQDSSLRLMKDDIQKSTKKQFGEQNVFDFEMKTFDIGQVMVYDAYAMNEENQVYKGYHAYIENYYIKIEFYMQKSVAVEYNVDYDNGEIRKIVSSIAIK